MNKDTKNTNKILANSVQQYIKRVICDPSLAWQKVEFTTGKKGWLNIRKINQCNSPYWQAKEKKKDYLRCSNEMRWWVKEVRQKQSIHHTSPLWNSRKCGGGGQEGKRIQEWARDYKCTYTKKRLVVTDMIITVTAVTVSWEHRDVEIHQIVYLDMCCLLYVSCTSVKLRSSLYMSWQWGEQPTNLLS